MFKKISHAMRNIAQVISKDSYLIIFLAAAAPFFLVLYFLTVANVAHQSIRIFVMMSGWFFTSLDIFLIAVISLLFGLYVALFAYRTRMMRTFSKTGTLGAIGAATGLFSAGCPTCGSVLFAIIGMPLALMSLPFRGMELKVLSIVLMATSLYFLAANLNTCKIKIKQDGGKS